MNVGNEVTQAAGDVIEVVAQNVGTNSTPLILVRNYV